MFQSVKRGNTTPRRNHDAFPRPGWRNPTELRSILKWEKTRTLLA